ncbi:MAG: vWA domain-containing protein [Pseudomonadota bacterium]
MMKSVLRRYETDERGNVAVMAGVAMSALLIGAVATVDFSMASNNQAESQNLADAMALAAAVKIGEQVKTLGHTKGKVKPTDMYVEGTVYKAKDLGFDFHGLSDGTDVDITFAYDLDNNEVRTVVRGQSQASFMSRMGIKSLAFSSESTAEIPTTELKHPASIALVIDNSNSMWSDEDPSAPWDQAHYDTQYNKFRYQQKKNHSTSDMLARQAPTGLEKRPTGTQQRIVSLRDALTSLNTTLSNAVADDPDQKYLRMGLIPFNHNFINSKKSNMGWGTIPAAKITGMSPSGETDTSKGMDKARSWLWNEHNKYNSDIRSGLKRYVILMTDGQNTKNRTIQINSPGSGKWRGQIEEVTPGRWHTDRPCIRHETRYRTSGEGGSTPYQACVERGPGTKRWIPEKSEWKWKTYRQATKPTEGRNWKEVDWVDRTRHRCDEMRKKGWEVFTVGYALTPGIFQRNLPGRPPQEYWATNQSEVDKAKDLLQYCATDKDNFLEAENAEQLKEAFEDIGASIANDSILRIKS